MTPGIAFLVLLTILIGCGLLQFARDQYARQRRRRRRVMDARERIDARNAWHQRQAADRQAGRQRSDDAADYLRRRYRDDGFTVRRTDGTEDYTSLDDRWKDADA